LRPKACLLAIHVKLQKIVASKLILDWSPEQISGWLKNQYPDDESMRVSHETIYRSLFIQARGVLKKELISTFGPSGGYAACGICVPVDTAVVKSSMPSPFGKGPLKSGIGPSPVIGRAICWVARTTVTSQQRMLSMKATVREQGHLSGAIEFSAGQFRLQQLLHLISEGGPK
jgi:hypothetical protein